MASKAREDKKEGLSNTKGADEACKSLPSAAEESEAMSLEKTKEDPKKESEAVVAEKTKEDPKKESEAAAADKPKDPKDLEAGLQEEDGKKPGPPMTWAAWFAPMMPQPINVALTVVVLSGFGVLYGVALASAVNQAISDNTAPVSSLGQSSPTTTGWSTQDVAWPQTMNNATHVDPYVSIMSWGPYGVDKGDIVMPPGPAETKAEAFQPLQLELTWAAFTANSAGGSADLFYRFIVPNFMLDRLSSPSKLGYTISCLIGTTTVVLTPSSPTFEGTIKAINFETGTNLQYPLDVYQTKSVPISCTLGATDPRYPIVQWNYSTSPPAYYYYPAIKNGSSYLVNVGPRLAKSYPPLFPTDYGCKVAPTQPVTYACPMSDLVDLNFVLKIATPDVGMFGHSESATQAYFDASDAQYPFSLTVTFQRSGINRIYPILMACLLWMVCLGQTAAVLVNYYGLVKVNTPAQVMVVVSVIFALPGIRGQLPGAPPVGIVLDWVSYYWCLSIAVMNFGLTALTFVRHAIILLPPPKKEETNDEKKDKKKDEEKDVKKDEKKEDTKEDTKETKKDAKEDKKTGAEGQEGGKEGGGGELRIKES